MNNNLSSGATTRLFSKNNACFAIKTDGLPTYYFQQSLPKLPLPSLDDTCQRYLEAVEPLVSADQFEKTRATVNYFKATDGAKLDARLRERDKANTRTSYIAQPWYDMYLESREPVVLNFNPFIMFQDDPNASDQLTRATSMVYSSMRFYQALSSGSLTPEVFYMNPAAESKINAIASKLPQAVAWYVGFLFNAYALDMHQHPRLFGTTRIPRPQSDQLSTSKNAKHIVVMRDGYMYKVNVLKTNSDHPLPIAQIKGALSSIINTPHQEDPTWSDHMGALTTQRRDVWANVRQALVERMPHNEKAFKTVDDALFVLCLDSQEPSTLVEANQQCLYGDVSNRWFDKSFQLIVTPSGKAAVNFEHSWGDGVAVMRYVNDVFDDALNYSKRVGETKPSSELSVEPVQWHIPKTMRHHITEAHARFALDVQHLRMDSDLYEFYGKNYLKQAGISPDATAQLAFQLAYYRMYGRFAPTYESASTSGFRYGRTETIRPVSHESCEWARSMCSHGVSIEDQRRRFLAAAKVHSDRVMAAVQGYGFDRHLFALRTLAQESASVSPSTVAHMPAIFTDPAYAWINHNILSTSTLVSDAVQGGGFAPVVRDGFGVGYAVLDNAIGLNITAYDDQIPLDPKLFKTAVTEALSDIQKVIDGRPFQVKSAPTL